MATLQQGKLLQRAVYWEASGADDYGESKVKSAVEIPVRWVKRQDEVLDAESNTIASVATVVVDRVIPVGSILWLGNLINLPSNSDDYTDLHQVAVYNETPNIKNRSRNTRRTVQLIRYSNQIPSSA